MNYHRIYHSLISKRQKQLVEGYTEKHHIVPKCMGGTNEQSNLVRLTAREHFIAHQLLAKMHPKEFGLLHAAWSMSNNHTSKEYEWLKRRYSAKQSDIMKKRIRKPMTDEHKRAIGRGNYKKTLTPEQRKAISDRTKGRSWSIDPVTKKRVYVVKEILPCAKKQEQNLKNVLFVQENQVVT